MSGGIDAPAYRRDLPDFDTDFVDEEDIEAFARAVSTPDVPEDVDRITAMNDWKPVNQRIRRKKAKRRVPRRGKDETREGVVYQLLKWPLLIFVFAWLGVLSILYILTRVYISQYEHWITWRGKRERLRQRLRSTRTYDEWKAAAKELDRYLGNEDWKAEDSFAYYDSVTVRKMVRSLGQVRELAQRQDDDRRQQANGNDRLKAVEDLRELVDVCVKSNFAGIESARLYSQTYYGTKNLVQDFYDEVESSLKFLAETDLLPIEQKRVMYRQLYNNFGKTALCLSGGASFAYYHFGVVKAHLDANLLPKIITGTSGGALVAALVCTRTDEELKKLLVPELADKITACHDDTITWLKRWWKTGARFDPIDWARRCCWFTRGSMTFREAYERTGRILNISCIPSDPHSPSLLMNYITAPDVCIFSSVLASAAVPGILPPVVLMTRTRHGHIEPYSFGNKWKDGSLRTDIPLRSLNLHFNVNFSIVSQVNPHVNIFFFSSRGSVGRPVTHRKGKGWRGGFLGSAVEQYIKLDLAKWLKVLRHLELLPRPMSQDWSSVFLQKFDGTITIWPKSAPSDFWYILTDPTPERLARMLEVGQRCTFPKLKFLSNRLRIEKLVEQGRRATRSRMSDLEEEVPISEDLQQQSRRPRQYSKQKLSPPAAATPAATNGTSRNNGDAHATGASLESEHSGSPGQSFKDWFTWPRNPRHRSIAAPSEYTQTEHPILSHFPDKSRFFLNGLGDTDDADSTADDDEDGLVEGDDVETGDEADGPFYERQKHPGRVEKIQAKPSAV